MLAYIFWHWRNPDADREAYKNSLIEFHKTLAAHKSAGFHYSVVFRVASQAPWLQASGDAYADWYLLEGSAALDPLNEAAVTGFRKDSHDKVARLAAGGAGSLYRLRTGEPNPSASKFALWLSKPAGTSYEEFYAQLQPWTSQPGFGLWGRQMLLGPTPEFCLLASTRVELPKRFDVFSLPLELIWSGA
jgi:hypothetical protein